MTVRRQSVEILQKVIEEKEFFSTFKSTIEDKDRPFANRLILTVLRNLCPLKSVLHMFVKKKIPEKVAIIEYVLLCGAAEILYFDTPDYAILNEYVSIAKHKADKFAAGMVNAVLRKIAADKENIRQKCDHFNVFPAAFQALVNQNCSKCDRRGILEMINSEPPLDISVKENPQLWAEKLNGKCLASGTVRVADSKIKIAGLPGYNEGAWWIQDAAAALPVLMLGDIRGKKILDLCAAPGGKTAQLLAGGAEVYAVDIDAERMSRLRQNLNRTGLDQEGKLVTVVDDGIRFLEGHGSEFEVVLLDAPCSASGTFRRHPEVIHNKGPKDVAKQLPLQMKMLETAAAHLKSDALILYSTCSLSHDEGEKQILEFLNRHPEFELVPAKIEDLNRFAGIKLPEKIVKEGVLRTMPQDLKEMGGMDAFFAAVIKKNAKKGEN